MSNFRKHKSIGEGYNKITIIPYQYRCTMTLLDEMLAIATADFPFLKKNDIEVVQQGGNYCRKMYAIEFEVPSDCKIPEDYIEAEINPTLS